MARGSNIELKNKFKTMVENSVELGLEREFGTGVGEAAQKGVRSL